MNRLPFITLDNVESLRRTLYNNLRHQSKRKSLKGPDGNLYLSYELMKKANPGLPSTLSVYKEHPFFENVEPVQDLPYIKAIKDIEEAISTHYRDWVMGDMVLNKSQDKFEITKIHNKGKLFILTNEKGSRKSVNIKILDRNYKLAHDVPNFNYAVPIGNYIAMDKDKSWCQYEIEPTVDFADMWTNKYIQNSAEYDTDPWHDWKDSLFLSTVAGLIHVTQKEK